MKKTMLMHPILKPAGDTAAILIADDHLYIRQLTRAILERAGYRTLEARDAHEAMAQLGEANIQLVISDLHLPGQSGAELIKSVKAQYPGVKLIMISSAFESAQTGLAHAIGINAILPKPVAPQTLLETVRDILG